MMRLLILGGLVCGTAILWLAWGEPHFQKTVHPVLPENAAVHPAAESQNTARHLVGQTSAVADRQVLDRVVSADNRQTGRGQEYLGSRDAEVDLDAEEVIDRVMNLDVIDAAAIDALAETFDLADREKVRRELQKLLAFEAAN